MPKSTKRPSQVGEVIQHALVVLLARQAQDPRLKALSITGVNVSPDLKLARVYFTLLDKSNELADVKQSLKKATGFFRAQLAQELHLRYMPRLDFIYDKTLDSAERISELLYDIEPKSDEDDENPA
jgi:ribosome-binding factor A